MPVTPSFPGIYIEELPSSTHTIQPAPTSVTVFLGYPHPFKTPAKNLNMPGMPPAKPVELFSFTDYEANFGGFFQSDVFAADEAAGFFSDLANAVNQFFLNGGGTAWVLGLQPQYKGTPITAASLPLGPFTFTALEITDANHQMQVAFSNPTQVFPTGSSVSQPADVLIDVLITYGPSAAALAAGSPVVTPKRESYRQVSLFTPTIGGGGSVPPQPNANYIINKINGVSRLVTVALPSASASSHTLPPLTPQTFQASLSLPSGYAKPSFPLPPQGLIFNPTDFTNVMQSDLPLDKLSVFNLMVIPGVSNFLTLSTAVSFCERKLAFLIMDSPLNDSADGTDPHYPTLIQDDFNAGGIIPTSPNAALYFPYLQSPDPVTGQTIEIPPSATVAGIYAATDTNFGVWQAPAGLATTLTNVIDVVDRGHMTNNRQGVLNPLGINCIRTFPAIGPVVFGARTSVSANPAFAQDRYINVRRMTLFLEQTLYANLTWVVFQNNDEPLWTAIRTSIEAFMLGLFRQGAFQGSKPSQAFQVKCDSDTTTQADIDNGIVNIVVAFAPLKPAEFVIIQIAQLAGQTSTS